jgi:hypothetical protein
MSKVASSVVEGKWGRINGVQGRRGPYLNVQRTTRVRLSCPEPRCFDVYYVSLVRSLPRVKKPNGSLSLVFCLVVFVCAISHRSESLKDTVCADRTVPVPPRPLLPLSTPRVFNLTFSEGGHRGGGLLDTSPHKGQTPIRSAFRVLLFSISRGELPL